MCNLIKIVFLQCFIGVPVWIANVVGRRETYYAQYFIQQLLKIPN